MTTTIHPTTCTCRRCNQPMDTKWQPATVPGRDGYHIVTCNTAGCALRGYTFTLPGYLTKDLRPYLKKETA